MARGAQKRVSQANQRAVATLAYGFLVSNTLFVLAACLRRQTSPWRTWTLYGITEFLAALIAWKLVAMAQVGDDLSLPGMTAYVKESSYSQVHVRLCVHYMVCARRCCTRITAVLVDLCGGMFFFFFFFFSRAMQFTYADPNVPIVFVLQKCICAVHSAEAPSRTSCVTRRVPWDGAIRRQRNKC